MIRTERFKGLEEKIGYTFTNKRTLALAMTHSSYANEQRGRRKANNERLEFLGDAVLEVTISDYVFREYPGYNVIGAIYLDGGMDRARTFIHTHLLKDVEDKSLFYDAKTILQEMVQAGPDPRLEYVLTREAGPDHNKEFTVEAKIGGKTYAIGKGKTKKGAEQIAAYQTILLLKKRRR